MAAQLQRQLRRLAPPRRAFVALSPHWVIAAKRAWRDVPVVYVFPCLLSHCLPFTWPRRRPTTLWKWLDFAGIRHAEHTAFDLADLVLLPTEQARQEIVAFHAGVRKRTKVCAYGCEPATRNEDLRTAQRRVLRLPADARVLLAVGVCDLNKAFDAAIRALPAVDARGQLVIVGDGPERASLTLLADMLSVSRRVHLVGAQRVMAPWYAAADAVISTSFYDTFPNALLEGMMHGRPVVVPRHDPPHVFAGLAEVVREGGGLLYDRCQPGSLAEVLNELLSRPHLAAELGQQACALARQRFRWEPCLDVICESLEGGAVDAADSASLPRRCPTTSEHVYAS
jgi:glycosyltransferase involved in cell wall biosynthesis